MKLKQKLAVALFMGVISTAASAAENHAYVFASLGQASYDGPSQSAVALRVGGGYNFVEIKGVTIGAEGAYVDFGSVSNSYSVGFATATADVKTTGLMANAIATYDIPKVRGLGVFGKLGMLHANSSATVSVSSYTLFGTTYPGSSASYSATSTGTFFGVGVKYSFNKEMEVRGQYEDFGSAVSVNGASTGLTMLSACFVYKFQ